MLGGRKAGGRQRHGVRSATRRAGLLAARQEQTVMSKSQDGKRGLLTAPSRAKPPPRDAVYLQELAEAQPSLGPLQPNVTVLLWNTKGQELGNTVGLPGGPQPSRHREGLLTRRSIVWRGKQGYEEEGTRPPSHSLHPRSWWHPEKSCHSFPLLAMVKMPMGSSQWPDLGLGVATSPGQKWVRRSWGQPQAQEGLLQAPLGMEGDGGTEPRGKALAGSLGISLPHLFLVFLKNKLRSSGRGEVGGNACAGGEGGRGRPAASSQKNNSSPLSPSQEKRCRASPRPTGTRAREEPPAEPARTLLLPRAPQFRTPTAQGAPRYAGPCSAGGTFWQPGVVQEVGEREKGVKKRYHGSTDGDEVSRGNAGVPARTKPRRYSFTPGQRGLKPPNSGRFSRA